MNIRPATVAEVESFYGPIQTPVSMLAIEDAGEIVGLGGLALCADELVAVSWFLPRAKQSPKTIGRLAHLVQAMMEKAGRPVYAEPDEQEPTADRFLRHIGFRKEEVGYVYRPAR